MRLQRCSRFLAIDSAACNSKLHSSFMKQIIFALLMPMSLFAQDIAGPRLRAHVKFLSSDFLEGRGPGLRGGELAADYLASQLAVIGAKPAGENGGYFQKVPLVGVNPSPSSTLTAEANGKKIAFKWRDDFVGMTQQQRDGASLNADAVFVGHGIVAPEYDWNDYAGVDVKGKVVVLFTNEPPSDDPKFFTGKALTYYGRWTYKYEEATRQGAVGCIIIHTTPTASYGFDVVRSSWAREDMQVKLPAGAAALSFAGWITQQKGDELFSAIGKTAAEMLQAADTRGFKAMPLSVKFRGSFPAAVRTVESRNVVGLIEGSDPKRKEEAVVFSAHFDHLGIAPDGAGDRIYNGAVDNATGCALVLEMAHAWMGLGHTPKRSALFLFVTAEESGLRGSEYFGKHPSIPPGKIALNVNLDSFYPFGRTTDVVVSGAERTTHWNVVKSVAQRFRLAINPDPKPEAGHYYRSDHFSFARVGVPAFSVEMGTHYAGKSDDFGQKTLAEYNDKSYHQPSDEYHAWWDFSGMEEIGKFAFTVGLEVSNQEKIGSWQKGDEFLAAREQSGVR